MPNRLHYIEPYDHVELIWRWAPVWEHLQDVEVICHVRSASLERFGIKLGSSKLRVAGPEAGESWASYLQRQDFSTADTVVLGTLGRNPGWFACLEGHPRFYVILHNLNYQLGQPTLPKGLPSFKTVARYALDRWNERAKQRLLTRANLVVPSQTMADYALQRYQRSATVLPFASTPNYPEKRSSTTGEDFFQLIIPGTVSRLSRDYKSVREAVMNLRSNPPIKLQITLLGKLDDKALINEFNEAFSASTQTAGGTLIRLRTFPNYLEQSTVDEVLQGADLILLPAREALRCGNTTELLGHSKTSGAVYDAISANKQLLLPLWFPLQASNVLRYTDQQDLAGQLLLAYKNNRLFGTTSFWPEYSFTHLLRRWEGLVQKDNS